MRLKLGYTDGTRVKAAQGTGRLTIHRNLHRSRSGAAQWVITRGGRVVHYRRQLALSSVASRIRQRARAWCAEAQQRTVCAFIEGSPCEPKRLPRNGWQRVQFDPRHDEAFVALDARGRRRRWNRAIAARFDADGSAWVLRPRWEPDDAV